MAFMDKVKELGRKIVESGTIVEEIKKKAQALNKRIVLCEGEDKRVVEAASICTQEKLAHIVLLGNREEIAKNNPVSISAISRSSIPPPPPSSNSTRRSYTNSARRRA